MSGILTHAHGPSSIREKFILARMFSRRWLLTTLLVMAAMAVMARLGIWQLDRLAQRRAFNARVLAQINQPPLKLAGSALNADLVNMEYRHIIVVGQYDFSQEVALRNQAHDNQYGVTLLTPLRIAGSNQSILVERGWIPADDFASGNLAKYHEDGMVEVHGLIRQSQSKPDFGFRVDPTLAPGQESLTTWNFVNVDRISQQVPYSMLPVYVQESPDPSWTGLPYRSEPTLDLSEGPHMGYAIQWFGFAALLGIGYPFYIRKEEARKKRDSEE
jgi:surfeit locus 1 family protein